MPIVTIALLSAFAITGAFNTAPVLASDYATVSIKMSTTGYTPADIEIEPNTKVVFYNADIKDFWPATDNHPTHTLYDGTSLEEHCSQDNNETFDACQAIKPGERWSFVFPTSGNFTYHDHLWPHLKGKITVTESGTQPTSQSYLEKFISFSHKLLTLIKETIFGVSTKKLAKPPLPSNPYVRKVIESDPRWAIEALRADAASSSELFARCHEVLHEIGKEAFYQYGSFGAASVFQSDFCNSGYIHGVFEAHFSVTGDPIFGMVEACENYAAVGGRPFDLWQCHHGIGHGFMYFTGGDVLAALNLCSETFTLEKATGDCHNGVYMELFNSETLAKEASYLNVDDPVSICEPMRLSRGDCYHYLPTYLSQKQLALADIFIVCDNVPTVHRDACKLGAGTEIMKRSMGKPQSVFVTCSELASLRDQILCVVGGVSMYVNQTASLTESYQLCSIIPEIYQQACLEVVNLRASDFTQST